MRVLLLKSGRIGVLGGPETEAASRGPRVLHLNRPPKVSPLRMLSTLGPGPIEH